MPSPGHDELVRQPFSAMRAESAPPRSTLRAAIGAAYRSDEADCVRQLLVQQRTFDTTVGADPQAHATAAAALARRLVHAVREERSSASGVDALMQEFSLSSEEGVALMCMAEALLRMPDRATADRLIADKLGKGDWQRHLGASPSLFVNAATWGLLITGKLLATRSEGGLRAALTRLVAKGGKPLVRKGVDLAMRMLGNQFVAGQTIAAALAHGTACEARGYQYSYDMLGEAALTAEDAQRYFAAYEAAIHAIGSAAQRRGIHHGPGISVKLSALHPRYEPAQRTRVMHELLPRLLTLAGLARHYAIGINIDAEEADRLELSLDLLEALAFAPQLAGFDGIGFVVQAYQKRCPHVIDWMVDLARRSGHRFMVRLVKGAYWDSEIKRAQVDGLDGYPVYTRKLHTDMSYLICARKLLIHADLLYPQFATHNAQTLAAVHTWALQAGVVDCEFQCLHGMGETLYDQVVGSAGIGARCRIYAPVGPHRTLLAYLVRRLLENGANSSFVNRLLDPAVSIDALIADPFDFAASAGTLHPQIVLPQGLYGPQRQNSRGFDFSDDAHLGRLARDCTRWGIARWHALPLSGPDVAGDVIRDDARMPAAGGASLVRNPADHDDVVGTWVAATTADVETALAVAVSAAPSWAACGAPARAAVLRRAADLLEQARPELLALAVREAGKTLPNALGELREAVDFLRFYAAQSKTTPARRPLGIVVCISPWNFPLAIFIGQISAALAAGNAVIAKPAEQTPLIAHRAVQLLYQAGVPRGVLHFLPGSGATVGAALVADTRVDAVLFTGSCAVAQAIDGVLRARGVREQRDIVLVAETGGQNAMIVDSSALPEQVVQDVLASAFDSAGQRCSALRVLCLQEEIADDILSLLEGALAQRVIGNPDRLSVDIGPVIDDQARARLLAHLTDMRARGHAVREMAVSAQTCDTLARGTFVVPAIVEIPALSTLTHEVFGPVLHVLRYRRVELPALLTAIEATGFGLTLGIHSRIDETIDFIVARSKVGNVYVNRSMVGAVVGSQPFGGEGLSGTGPKAGGPLYLRRLQQSYDADCDATDSGDSCPGGPMPVPALPALTACASVGLDWIRSLLIDGAEIDSAGEAQCASRHYGTQPGVELPGPTGERNTLRLAARGTVLCLPGSRSSLLQQLEAVLVTGNRALVCNADLCAFGLHLPESVLNCVSAFTSLVPPRAVLAAVLVDQSYPNIWRDHFADGAVTPGLSQSTVLMPVVKTRTDQQIDLDRLLCERMLTINTTAAGGNASLMTLGT